MKNALSLVLANLIGSFLQIVSVSLYLKFLGKDLYSIYIVVATICGYLSIVVPDFTVASQKLIIDCSSNQAGEGRFVLRSHLALSLAYSLVLLALHLVAAFVAHAFYKPLGIAVPLAIVLSGIATSLATVSGVYTALLSAKKAFVRLAYVSIVASVLSTAAGLYIAYRTSSLISLFISGLINSAVQLVLLFAWSRAYGERTAARPSADYKKRILVISYRAYLHKVVNLFAGSLDRLMLAKASNNLSNVTDYSLSYRVPEALAGIVSPAISSIVPGLTEKFSVSSKAAVDSLVKYLRMTAYFCALWIVVPCAYGQPLLDIWLGKNAPQQGLWIVLLIGAYFYFNLYYAVATRIFHASGEMHFVAPFSGFNALATLIFSIPVVKCCGIVGLAGMNAMINLVQLFPFLLLIHSKYSRELNYLREGAHCLAVLAAAMAVSLGVILLFRTELFANKPWLCFSTAPIVVGVLAALSARLFRDYIPEKLRRFLPKALLAS